MFSATKQLSNVFKKLEGIFWLCYNKYMYNKLLVKETLSLISRVIHAICSTVDCRL